MGKSYGVSRGVDTDTGMDLTIEWRGKIGAATSRTPAKSGPVEEKKQSRVSPKKRRRRSHVEGAGLRLWQLRSIKVSKLTKHQYQ